MDVTSLTKWARKYSIRPKGVVHVGAHLGEEREEWSAITKRVIWYEANPELWDGLEANVLPLGHEVVRSAVGSSVGTLGLNVASFTMSSSPLPLARHAVHYPGITYVKKVEVPVVTLDSSLAGRYEEFDYLYMDVQGYEGQVLLGATEFLKHVRWIYSEYNGEELYKGCWLYPKMCEWLEARGFVVTNIAQLHPAWGDGFWIKGDL